MSWWKSATDCWETTHGAARAFVIYYSHDELKVKIRKQVYQIWMHRQHAPDEALPPDGAYQPTIVLSTRTQATNEELACEIAAGLHGPHFPTLAEAQEYAQAELAAHALTTPECEPWNGWCRCAQPKISQVDGHDFCRCGHWRKP